MLAYPVDEDSVDEFWFIVGENLEKGCDVYQSPPTSRSKIYCLTLLKICPSSS